jgi:hypothetical protein
VTPREGSEAGVVDLGEKLKTWRDVVGTKTGRKARSIQWDRYQGGREI